MNKKILNYSFKLPNGIYSLLEKLSVPIFGLLVFFMLIRSFEQETFGCWVIYVSLTALTESVLSAFTLTPFILFNNSCQSTQKGILFFTSLLLNTSFAIFISVGLLVFGNEVSYLFNTPVLATLLELYCLNLILIVPFIQLNALQYANSKFRDSFYSMFIRRFLFFLYVSIAFLSPKSINLEELVIAQIIATLLSLCVSYMLSRRYLYISYKIDTSWIEKLFNYSKYTVGNNLTSIIAKNIDTWMIGGLISANSVAIYNPAIKISSLIEVPTGALSTYIYPKFIYYSANNQLYALQKKIELTIGFNLAIFLPVILIIYSFGERIIILIAGETYVESLTILYITLLHTLFIPFERHLGVAFNALGKANYNLWLSLSRAGVNIILNYLFIVKFGLAGAAIATLITYLSGTILSILLIKKVVPLRLDNILFSALEFFSSPLKTAKSV